MKLVDAEITHEEEEREGVPHPPSPPRRRVYTSLVVTLTVLFGTVITIYTLFPKRDNELLTAAIEAHMSDASVLEEPTGTEIRAWSLGVFGEPVPWPEVDSELIPASATLEEVFRAEMAIVRYQLHGQRVSLAVRRARDAAPRVHRRTEDGLHAVSWRCRRFTCIAVGPEDTADTWKGFLGAP